ncbi:MAG: MBOAT family protein, partial [Xanthomonadales bacterium]|nr:MBOAT family protein [Xanthomonadales bacterium]
YLIGRLLFHHIKLRKMVLGIGVTLNLIPLLFFKYFTFFLEQLGQTPTAEIHLPLGISFFTFQAISYLVDVYREQTPAERNLINLGLYIALFPQLIAGPIVRFRSINKQLAERLHSKAQFIEGIERLIFGLSKKLLIANPLGFVADQIYALPSSQIDGSLAWMAAISYTMQIYFDFSAYSDMAIGLANMFGFKIPENFNYPYMAQSIQEFWRRWHISLSRWFRDYLYIPLGGNRLGDKRTYFNLLVVFTLCGFWHGASWSFVIWGLYHGLFLILERLGLTHVLLTTPRLFRHAYALLVVIFGWVFFRVESIGDALAIQGRMLFTSQPENVLYSLHYFVSPQFYLALFFGLLLSTSVFKRWSMVSIDQQSNAQLLGRNIWIIALLLLNFVVISASTYNPFIYFRF